jgi:hypothetical protein
MFAPSIGCGAGLFGSDLRRDSLVRRRDGHQPAALRLAAARGTPSTTMTREDSARRPYDVLCSCDQPCLTTRRLLASALVPSGPAAICSSTSRRAGVVQRVRRRRRHCAVTAEDTRGVFVAFDRCALSSTGLSLVLLAAARAVARRTRWRIRSWAQPPSGRSTGAKALSRVELTLLTRPPLGTSVIAAVCQPEV